MTTSSIYREQSAANNGRLDGNTGDGWCPQNNDGQDWLKIDLGKTFEICGVATQGSTNDAFYATAFKLSYSTDDSHWTNYLDSGGSEMVTF